MKSLSQYIAEVKIKKYSKEYWSECINKHALDYLQLTSVRSDRIQDLYDLVEDGDECFVCDEIFDYICEKEKLNNEKLYKSEKYWDSYVEALQEWAQYMIDNKLNKI
ncbi:MAG: hypothetical protein J1F35_08050 [Erysipelotrichales bacterium]|nr:hypothetical protein [Erysipelotrichales bacterium]